MMLHKLILLHILVCMFGLCINGYSQAKVPVSITIEGLEVAKGSVYLALYDSEETWLGDALYLQEIVRVTSTPALTFTIAVIPGEYGISLYHDENENDVLDTNAFGYPREPFTFSGEPSFRLGPPKFEQCLVAIDRNNASFSFTLND